MPHLLARKKILRNVVAGNRVPFIMKRAVRVDIAASASGDYHHAKRSQGLQHVRRVCWRDGNCHGRIRASAGKKSVHFAKQGKVTCFTSSCLRL